MRDVDYWEEFLSESFVECGIGCSQKQLRCVAIDMCTAHENYMEGVPSLSSSDHRGRSEVTRLKEELQEERSKVTCGACNGTGTAPLGDDPRIKHYAQCTKCKGNGRC